MIDSLKRGYTLSRFSGLSNANGVKKVEKAAFFHPVGPLAEKKNNCVERAGDFAYKCECEVLSCGKAVLGQCWPVLGSTVGSGICLTVKADM